MHKKWIQFCRVWGRHEMDGNIGSKQRKTRPCTGKMQLVKTTMQALRDRHKGMNEKACEPNGVNTSMRRKAASTSSNASRKTNETDECNISQIVVANNNEDIDFDCSKLTTSACSIDEHNGNSGGYDTHDALRRIAFLEKNLAAL